MPLILDGTKGETFPSWTTATRPATPNAGQTGYNTTLAILETYNGSVWCPFVTTATTFAGNGPAFSAYASGNQSVTSSVATKVTLGLEDFDTNNNFASSRFTPTVAGYYIISAYANTGASSQTFGYALIYKNGSIYLGGSFGAPYNASQSGSMSTALVSMNGTTDYIELYVQLDGTSPTVINTTAGFVARLAGALVRAA